MRLNTKATPTPTPADPTTAARLVSDIAQSALAPVRTALERRITDAASLDARTALQALYREVFS